MSATLLDDFHDLRPWTAIAPGAAQLRLTPLAGEDGPGLRLDYDLGGNGFVIARRALALHLPQDYAFTLETRGAGVQHIVEFKLVDEHLANVWRLRDEHFTLHAAWTPWRIGAADIGYAWGAHRARRLAHCDALELAIVGAGQGSLSLRNLRLLDESYRGTPRASASSALPGHAADCVLQDDGHGWRSASGGAQHLMLAFEAERAFSAVHIDWLRDAPPLAFAIDIADRDGEWRQCYRAEGRPGPRSTVLLPGTRTAAVRLRIDADAQGCGIRHVAFEPWYSAPTLLDGLSAMAMAAPRGQYPKALREEQSYWTVTGAAAGSGVALLNTEGLLEVDHGDFAIEAFVRLGTRLYSWADVQLEATLEDDYLPLPCVRWRSPDFTLEVAPVMTGAGAEASLSVDYRLTNLGAQTCRFTLYLVVRPYLVTPVWQIWQGRGGIAPLRSLRADAHGLYINDERRVHGTTPADAYGASGFAGGDLLDGLREGRLPSATEATDRDALASGVLAYALQLGAGDTGIIACTVPARGAAAQVIAQPAAHHEARAAWRDLLGPCPITLPAAHMSALLTLRTAAAHILVNRDGPRLQPGPRRYVRAYLRDAVGMGTALARLGIMQPLKDLLDWYGPHQRADGELPDAIDDDGPEWLPEYDAYGQYLHGVAEAQRLAPDADFLARQWPIVQRVLARLEQLRALRSTDDQRNTPYFGVLPESMSHEGYMAQPVHAYWDDFWALRGLRDAAWLATQVGAQDEARRLAELAARFAADLHRSLAASMAHHAIDFIPGSVELGDFDATAIAVALTVADDGAQLPRAALDATFDRYLAIRAARLESSDWSNYSAYEIRIVGALIRLDRRDDALQLLHALLADCRPPAWRQWPEQSWRVYDAPAFLGDLPHSWIGAEYIHALTSAFAYERLADASLVLAAGVDSCWLTGEGVTVKQLVTHHGLLSYRLWRDDDARIEMRIEAGVHVPPGGFTLMPPLPARLRAVTVNGQAHHDFDDHACRCHALPAHVVFYCGEAPA